MARGVRWYLVGSLVLVTLVGCARNWIAQREAWRHEAEVACLKSGAVREGPAVVRIEPINGPGMCGADFPLKVAALGTTNALAYVGDLRPPASIPGAPATSAPPRWPITEPRYAPPPPRYGAPVEPDYPPPPNVRSTAPPPPYNDFAAPGRTLSLTPPGLPQPNADATVATEPPSDRGAYLGAPRNAIPPPPPALGPLRVPQFTAAIMPAAVKPTATLACPLVSELDRWIATAVQPAAMRWFGQQVVAIKQISAYSCRGMNGNPHARISEHAFGNALDIAAFTLADGRKITVRKGWHSSPEEQGFLRDVQAAACEQFNTVLAPGSNRYHADHFHFDLMRRRSGRRICKPHAVSGEVVAARVRARLAGRRYDPAVTGSVKKPVKSKTRESPDQRIEDEEDDDHAFLATPFGAFRRVIPASD